MSDMYVDCVCVSIPHPACPGRLVCVDQVNRLLSFGLRLGLASGESLQEIRGKKSEEGGFIPTAPSQGTLCWVLLCRRALYSQGGRLLFTWLTVSFFSPIFTFMFNPLTKHSSSYPKYHPVSFGTLTCV